MKARFETLGDMVRHHGQARGEAVALSFGGRDTSFAHFQAHCGRVAAGLIAAGCRHGSRVAYLGKNSDLFFELLLGAAMVGVVVVPLNWRLSQAELEAVLGDAEAELLFATAEYHDLALKMEVRHAGLRRVIEIEHGLDAGRHFTAWRDGQHPLGDTGIIVSRADVFLQLYTSGTTGRPKGVMLTHGSVLGVLEAADPVREPWRIWTPDMVGLVAMPVFHISGTGWGLGCLYGGGRSVILPEFSIPGVEHAIEALGATHVMMVPAALQMLIDKWEAGAGNWSSLRQIVYGASPMPPALLRRSLALLGCDFVQYYGMTETTGSVVALAPEDHLRVVGNRLASTGRIMAGNAIRIADGAGSEVESGTVGEVWIKTPGTMLGYWNLPQATVETITPEGWVRTGDAGYLDADGYLFLCDRIKDMIISGGENIYPIEVENVLASHPAVAEVAVIGVPDDRWGETVKAVVVPKDGASVTAEALIAYARNAIAGYKVPRSVDFVGQLPRNSAGKILKRELRAPYWVGRERSIA
ncbi:long-chain-fatty-acid--CoA ligase [Sphingomonas sp.]|uniref:long-chain-fatty-acid--CoA ligase n=1 Tax=Sphingomonas sp. TaxID=28214 RepID=UPI001EB607AF|nr:long-chain-fatty-acid--CoA ligase [Sphingomonas sp.]MBX3593400.1 long-chain-fatty-acid--CoA ligase [Sphingomonas sp.]